MANDLPPEILRMILRELELKDRIRQRLVCRKWRGVIESLRINHLSIVDSKFAHRYTQFLDFRLMNFKNLTYYPEMPLIAFDQLFSSIKHSFGMKKKEARSLLFDPKNPMFSGVRRLFVALRTVDNFSFEEFLNCQFEQLEELSFYSLHFFSSRTWLRLANLKVLFMQNVKASENNLIQLDLPKLEQFATFSKIQFFHFLHPQSLRHLTLLEDHESIFQFKNLQVLSCKVYRNTFAIFSNMPQLKEIHYESLELIKNFDPAAIYRAKQGLGRSDLKMVVLGLDFKHYREKSLSVEYINKNFNEFIVTNYSILGPWPILSLFLNAHYGKLTGLFEQGIPSDFKHKFPNLKSVVATKIESDGHLFFKFLKIYPNLCRLHLIETFDEMVDYDKWYGLLPDYCKRLRILIIRSKLGTADTANELDLGFLLKFKYLQTFTTTRAMSGQFALSMWHALRYLKSQELVGKILVRKYELSQLFEVTLPNRKVANTSLKELKKFFN